MIKFEDVSKIYGDKIALDSLNLEIEDGEIFGLIGHNGAGKSTSIKSLVGILEYEKGDIYIDGINIKDDPIAAKKKIGYVSDSPDMFLKMTPYELWKFIKTIYEVSDEDFDERIKSLTQTFELEEYNQTIESFSHGMRQKTFLIATLLTDPSLWVMDEPLTGLDPQSSYNLKEMMREHAKKGNTVLFSTHVLDIAEKLCDRIGILKKGKLIFLGSMDDLKKSYPDLSLEEIYLKMIKSYEDPSHE